MSYTELKREVFEANMELNRRNLVVYTWGNVSQIDRAKGVIAIKPSGVAYEVMTVDDIVVVDLENNIVEGKMRPSSDTKTHTHLYRHFDIIGGVTHTHSTYATAWAQTQQAIPCYGTTHADYAYGEIPCTAVMTDEQIERDYEEETGVQITDCFK
ncbi:MAG: araD, partial [Cellvibrio sp.]|nr:araD [Cellvibrio sp.]